MAAEYEIDNVDRKILLYLRQDARMAYSEIAKKLLVSGGTIHQRINKMTEAGVIKGSSITIDYSKLGFDVTTLLGIHLGSAKNQKTVTQALLNFKEVTEVYYTTGTYALIIKVVTKSIKEFHQFLVEKLQLVSEIQSTESFICLDKPVDQDLTL